MIYQLMRRDPAWSMTLYMAVLEGLGAVGISMAWKIGGLAQLPLYVMVLCMLLGVSISQLSEGPFYAALPVATEQIWLARALNLLLLIWIPALVAAGISLVAGSGEIVSFVVLSALAMPTGMILWSLALRGVAISMRAGVISIFMAMGACMAAFPYLRLQVPTVPILAVCSVISAAIFGLTLASIPFPERIDTKRTSSAARDARSPHSLWWLFSWIDVLWFGTCIDLSLTGGTWISGIVFMFSIPLQSRERLRWLDSLPVSRRFLLLVRAGPLIAGLIFGYLTGIGIGYGSPRERSIFITSTQQWPPDTVTTKCAQMNIEPPLDHWRLTKGTQPPSILAPWGESFRPATVRVYGIDIYDPYAVGCDNSQAFFDWQHKRALSAVYGSPDFAAREGAAPPRARTVVVNVFAIVVASLLAMLPLFVYDWWRFQMLPKGLRIGLSVLAIVGFLGAMVAGQTWDAVNKLQWVSWALPDGLTSVIVAGVSTSFALLFATDRLFQQAELSAYHRVVNSEG